MAPSLSQGSQRAASSGAGARAVSSGARAAPARQEQQPRQQATLFGAVEIAEERGHVVGLAALYRCLGAGADPNARDVFGRVPLHYAALIPDTATVTKVIRALAEEGADTNAKEQRLGRKPLHMAAMNPNPEAAVAAARALLAAGADAKAVTRSDDNVLHWAAQNNNAAVVTALVPLLVEAGADVNAKSVYGRTPLHWAAENASAATAAAGVQALLAARASASATDDDGRTPLHLAARNSSPEAAAAAINALAAAPGIDVNAADTNGKTPLHVAAANEDAKAAAAAINALAAVRLAAAPGVNVNAADEDGETPLHVAAARNEDLAAAAGAARALLAAGGNPHICNSNGMPPLVVAMQRKDAGACGELLQVLAEAGGGSGGSGAAAAGPSGSAGAGPSNAGAAGPSGSNSAADPSRLLNLAAAGFRQLLKRKAPAASEEETECKVCMDAPRSHAVLPCFHLALCGGCAEQLCTKRRSQCPICRDTAKGSQRIYLS